jgi:hypothetical protein
MRNIKEIRAERDALRAEYEAKVEALEAEIVAVRKSRGFVSAKTIDYTDYYEPGRSAPMNHNGSFQY